MYAHLLTTQIFDYHIIAAFTEKLQVRFIFSLKNEITKIYTEFNAGKHSSKQPEHRWRL